MPIPDDFDLLVKRYKERHAPAISLNPKGNPARPRPINMGKWQHEDYLGDPGPDLS